MADNHDPLSVATDDDEVVVSVFNIDVYESARVRLGPEEAESRAYELLEAASELRDRPATAGSNAGEETGGPDGGEMGVPRGGPPTTPFVERV